MVVCSAVSCNSSCIEFRHSGGGANCNPCLDLGGAMSSCAITASLNNLFHSIGPELSREGHLDYRCFYITNTSVIASLRNVKIYLGGTGTTTAGKRGGTQVYMGVSLVNEIQDVIVAGANPPNDGDYFELTVPGYSPSFKVYYSTNITEWVGNFQTAIRTVDGLQGAIVTSTGTIPNVTFHVNFGGNNGQAANHLINLMAVVDNLTNCTVTILSNTSGSPVNTTALTIPDEITPPIGINFDTYLRGNPILVGDLRPGDFLPIWIKRVLPFHTLSGALATSGQMAKLLDNFNVVVEATSP